ncbi:hypothetical protein H477_3925 [[Clostridium] sordellii ATCC 9714]|nr:hypothetical protein H477_3925 [[Clostridium] sordellii ATCC 9714] [Paeniclostridium sordellii ATCC 9714]
MYKKRKYKNEKIIFKILSFIFNYSFEYTIFPSIIVYKVSEKTSIGLPVNIAISASFPTSILPTISSTPHIFAGFIVIAFNDSSIPNPSLAANPAHIGKY